MNVREDLITLRVDLPVWERVFIVNRLVEVGNGVVRGPGVNDMKGWRRWSSRCGRCRISI